MALSLAAAILPATSAASPVATSDGAYTALGRVFPDPLAGCQNFGMEPCSPNAQGNFPATQFIQFPEFEDALEYMNQNPTWSNYLEVWPLATGEFPGNNLGRLEFNPSAEFKSAGIPRSDLGRQKSDLYVLRVTDESVPDAGKKRYALSLSIHGIERAGAEGGTRAMEDLVTAATTGKADDTIVPTSVDPNAPTFADVLRHSIIYFTYPNPDGWRRGDVTEGNFFFQRYNGNGVDPNRDWPDIGYSFRGYSGQSEPETRAFSAFYRSMIGAGIKFSAGDDLHGQAVADALSYTLLPHGRHDFAKNLRIRNAAVTIHNNSEQALQWSPIIQANDAPPNGGLPCVPTVALGDACALLYGQTWGTVYDTINYTTTGALGDWFDSKKGLGADGIDNEMSYSHIDRNVVFDPHGEQLHVDGNKALIYAHLDQILSPPENPTFDAAGHKGYIPSPRLSRDEQSNQPDDSGQDPQAPINMGPKPQTGAETIYDAADGIHVDQGNGGMRVEVTMANLQGVAPSYQPIGNQVTLRVECRGCDDHRSDTEDPNEWVVVSDDFNQKQLYQAAGLTAAVNRPDATKADGSPTEWRLVIGGAHGATRADVEFTRGPATSDGNTGGDEPPKLLAYDVANTDFFTDLNGFSRPNEMFDPVQPQRVLDGEQDLDALDTFVLSDDALPGYTGRYGAPVSGLPHENFAIESQKETVPAAHQPDADRELSEPRARVPGSYETIEWDLAPEEANRSMKVEIGLPNDDGDFDIYLYRVEEDGRETFISNSGTDGSHESIALGSPPAGHYKLYVDNWLATADTHWVGQVTFEGYPNDDPNTDTGAYSGAEKEAWIATLKDFVEGGGNLVLTDGALLALPDLVPGLERTDVTEQTVYVGQVAFSDGSSDTTGDSLAADVAQPGARFNSGMRRQTFEPTPLGFAIQDQSGADESRSPQFDVNREAWVAAGGRYVAGSANSAARDAEAVYDRVTIGELQMGEGRIRIIGALLPQPSQAFDHPLGLEPYAVTYTGYTLARNLFGWDAPGDRTGLGGGDTGGGQEEQDSPGSGTPQGGGQQQPIAGAPVKKAKRCKKKKRAKKARRCKKKKKRR